MINLSVLPGPARRFEAPTSRLSWAAASAVVFPAACNGRAPSAACTPHQGGTGDGFHSKPAPGPFCTTNENVNRRMRGPTSVLRFRPRIRVSGNAAPCTMLTDRANSTPCDPSASGRSGAPYPLAIRFSLGDAGLD
jgi:hypothetical protein